MPGGAVRSLVVAAMSFSLMALFARLAGEGVPSFEIVFVRSLISLALTVAFLRRLGIAASAAAHKGLLVLRGLFGFGALTCFFYSVTHLPLAEATVIQFTAPIFTAILASVYLGERATRRLWGAIALGLCGVLLITRPAALFSGDASELPGRVVLVGLAGASLTSVAHVLVRRLAPVEHELVIVLYFPLVAVPASLVSAVPVWIWPTVREWAFLLAVGVTAQSGQIFLTRGMRETSAAGASVILYLQILFAIFWGLLVLGERPDGWTLGGSLLVLGGTLAAARRPRLPA
jgi:drug/metabolite transporter (DMT)-like permease